METTELAGRLQREISISCKVAELATIAASAPAVSMSIAQCDKFTLSNWNASSNAGTTTDNSAFVFAIFNFFKFDLFDNFDNQTCNNSDPSSSILFSEISNSSSVVVTSGLGKNPSLIITQTLLAVN